MSTLRRRLATSIELSLLLVALLVPLWVNLWAVQPFDLSKVLLLRSLVWGAAAFWLADLLLVQRLRRPSLRRIPLLGPLILLTAVYIISTLTAADWRLSLWGSYDRGQGLLTLITYLILFVIVATRLRTRAKARRLIGVMVLSAVPMILLGAGQALGWNPLGLVTNARSPIYTTLGRSNFVGAYLAILLPLTLASLTWIDDRRLRTAGVILCISQLVIIGLTLSRGAWLAAATALGAFLLLRQIPTMSRRQRRHVLIGIAGIAIAGITALFWFAQRDAGSIAARFTIWKATLTLIRKRPLFGYGLDSLGLVFPSVYPPELVYYQGRGLLVDRAHNVFLDTLLTSGVLGMLAWIIFLAGIARAAWPVLRRTEHDGRRPLVVAALSAAAGNLVGNLVGFDVTATTTASWILMGLVVGLARPAVTDDESPVKPPRAWEPALAAGATVAILAAIYFFNVRPLLADVSVRRAQRYAGVGNWPAASAAAERAMALAPHEPAYYRAASALHLQHAHYTTTPESTFRNAEALLRDAIDLRPNDFRTWQALGDLYGAWTLVDSDKLPAAYSAYHGAAELAPTHATVYAGWGDVAYRAGDYETAYRQFKRAVDLDATDSRSFAALGDIELLRGNTSAAIVAYEEAIYWNPTLTPAYVGLSRAYLQLDRHEAAIETLENATRLKPQNPNVQGDD